MLSASDLNVEIKADKFVCRRERGKERKGKRSEIWKVWKRRKENDRRQGEGEGKERRRKRRGRREKGKSDGREGEGVGIGDHQISEGCALG